MPQHCQKRRQTQIRTQIQTQKPQHRLLIVSITLALPIEG